MKIEIKPFYVYKIHSSRHSDIEYFICFSRRSALVATHNIGRKGSGTCPGDILWVTVEGVSVIGVSVLSHEKITRL